ncbi:sensor domain-containing protein [Mycolicibacterium grossiae]|uniref:sensor domain-containing protein n=1 Tax=Mycolicibacterium grossiae TaxID=1552759 RepID=UPI0009F24849|nr:diguanylate cyclase [Mycolicibacterium grossiae]QEM44442.1 diguanylate cyclase [Mycolicibacterium grossiae]
MGDHRDDAAADVDATGSSAEHRSADHATADERYRLLLEHSPDAICVHQHGRLVYVNEAAVRWMRADSAAQLVGGWITEFVNPESIPPMLERIAGLRNVGDVSEPSEAAMLRFDGNRLDVEAVSVLTTWNGEPANQVVFRDVSAQKAAETALRYQAALVHHASDAIIATTLDGDVTSWNPAAETIYGRQAAAVLGRSVAEAVGAELNPCKILGVGGVVTDTHYDAHGRPLTVRVSAAAMDDGYVLLCTDQTALRRAEQHFEKVVSSLDEGVLVLDHTGRILSVNPAVRRLLGVRAEHLVVGYRELTEAWSEHWEYVVYDEDGAAVDANDEPPILRTLRDGTPFSGEAHNRSAADGQARWLAVTTCRLNPEDGRRSAVLISFRDISATRQAAERFAHQALHDPLTGLPNRTNLSDSIDRMRADGRLAALLFVDLDDLKGVNDSLGHAAGDVIIQAAAHRLRGAVRADDVVCRFAGDEFVVLLVGPLGADALTAVTDRIRAMMAEPIVVAGFAVQMGASIGVVETRHDDGRDGATLLRLADRAMYHAKATGRRTAVLFTTEA